MLRQNVATQNMRENCLFLAVYATKLILLRSPVARISASGRHHMRNDPEKSHRTTAIVAKESGVIICRSYYAGI